MARRPNGHESTSSATNRRNLKKDKDKVALLRRVGVSWLELNASETIWPGMTVQKLCCTVSGWSFPEYLAKMRQDREWVDTAFLHALGRAHGVNVVVLDVPCRAFGCVHAFAAVHSAVVASSHRSHKQNCIVRSVRIKLGQATAELRFAIFVCERALGAWLLEPLWCFMCVREIALAVCARCAFNLVALVRATKVVIFQAHTDETLVGEYLTDSAQHKDRAPSSLPVALVNDHHFWAVVPCTDEAAVDPIDKGEHAAMRSKLGKGLCPSPSRRGHDVAGDPNGLDDGEPPAVAFPDANPPR